MAEDASPPVYLDLYSALTPQATIGITVAGLRKVTVTHGIGGLPTELTCLTGGEGRPEVDMDKINEIDGRVRGVEQKLERIDERLKHMPTTVAMWTAISIVSLAVGSAVVAVLWFAFQKMLEPLLAAAGSS